MQKKSRQTRRTFIQAAAATAVFAGSAKVQAQDHTNHKDHNAHNDRHHHHSGGKYSSLIDKASHCVKQGIVCEAHCIDLLRAGNISIVDCLDVVRDAVSMCETLMQLASSDSSHLKAFGKVCLEVCKDCAKQCRRHKDMHAACKECMESCIECIRELEKLVA